MVGIAEIGGAIGGLKGALDLVKGVKAVSDGLAVQDVQLELGQRILDAQAALSAALAAQAETAETIRQLEQEIVKLKDWETRKERYEFKAIGSLAFAYMPKEGMDNGEPPHWLCQPCFESGHKRTLQFAGTVTPVGGLGILSVWKCGSCGGEIRASRNATPADPSSWD